MHNGSCFNCLFRNGTLCVMTMNRQGISYQVAVISSQRMMPAAAFLRSIWVPDSEVYKVENRSSSSVLKLGRIEMKWRHKHRFPEFNNLRSVLNCFSYLITIMKFLATKRETKSAHRKFCIDTAFYSAVRGSHAYQVRQLNPQTQADVYKYAWTCFSVLTLLKTGKSSLFTFFIDSFVRILC